MSLLQMIYLIVHFTWEKWPKVRIFKDSRGVKNGSLVSLESERKKAGRLKTKNLGEEASGWTYGSRHEV